MRLLNEKSQFWVFLFKCLSNSGYDKCNLESAIHAAYDIRKLRYINPISYMFILTDGLYKNEQKQLIKNHLIACQHNRISIFGIGIGIYPRGIIDMFPNIIFATYPNYLIHVIASFFGNQTVESYNDSIKHLTPEIPSIDEFTSVIKKLNEFIEKPIFIDLKQHLAKTPHALFIKKNVSSLKRNVSGVLRFSIQWNDVGDCDNNDLDAHCIEPGGFHIVYCQKVDKDTGGNLDVDITDPKQNKPACENITWSNINKMQNGTYKFYVHQYAYINGHSGFRAEIESLDTLDFVLLEAALVSFSSEAAHHQTHQTCLCTTTSNNFALNICEIDFLISLPIKNILFQLIFFLFEYYINIKK